MSYNYKMEMYADVEQAIKDNYTAEEIREALTEDREAFEQKLNDDLWIDDSVTGNASGSYTFNAYQAEENLCHNMELLGEALQEFGCGAEYITEKGAEACDVTIRCYLLAGVISEVLDDLENEYITEE